jgi:predicted transcriptional regulator
MIDQINSNKKLFFQNTPLQNLKNILSDADAFMVSKMFSSPNNHPMEQPAVYEMTGISKSALQEALSEVIGTSGQYISSSAVSRMVRKLWEEENGENIFKIEDFNNNTTIKKLRNIIKTT